MAEAEKVDSLWMAEAEKVRTTTKKRVDLKMKKNMTGPLPLCEKKSTVPPPGPPPPGPWSESDMYEFNDFRIRQPKSPPPPQPQSDDDDYDDEPEEEYGNKKVFLSIANRSNIESWVIIDPSQLIESELEYSPEFNLPPDLLKNYFHYRSAVCNSTMYLIGGQRRRAHFFPEILPEGPPEFLDTMYIFNSATKCWQITQAHLNVARSLFQAVVIGKLIYIFGGMAPGSGDTRGLGPHNWIECYDPNTNRWQLLPTNVPSHGSKFVSDKLPEITDLPHTSVLYERGRQVLFFYSQFGFHTFNYVHNTWAFVRTRIDNFNCFGYVKVVIVKHVLFCAYDGLIYIYDLKKRKVVSEHSFVNVRVPTRELYLFRVGTNTLLLFYWETLLLRREENKEEPRRHKKILHCRRFQIQNESPGSCGISLYEDAHHLFVTQDGQSIVDSWVK